VAAFLFARGAEDLEAITPEVRHFRNGTRRAFPHLRIKSDFPQ
jgi:hypothetical protein